MAEFWVATRELVCHVDRVDDFMLWTPAPVVVDEDDDDNEGPGASISGHC